MLLVHDNETERRYAGGNPSRSEFRDCSFDCAIESGMNVGFTKSGV